MSELISNQRKDALRKIVARLHAGESPEALKEEFKGVLGEITPLEISQVEAELVSEGTTREELMSLCDVHMAMFKESLSVEPDIPNWHPIHILLKEHRGMLDASERIWKIARDESGDDDLQTLAAKLSDTEVHYQREENVLFPYLEKHGITEPPAIMWMEHDRIRVERKAVISLIESGTRGKLLEAKARAEAGRQETLRLQIQLAQAQTRVAREQRWLEHARRAQGMPLEHETAGGNGRGQ